MENRPGKVSMNKKTKIEVGVKYRNIHTMKFCTITSKHFFLVEYKDDTGSRGSVHYKRFAKNWRKVPPKCIKCGLDCKAIGGSQWLNYECKKEVKDDEADT